MTVTQLPPIIGREYLGAVKAFVLEEGILEEWGEEDVELDPASGDEAYKGQLLPNEREWFILGHLLQEVVQGELVEADASAMERATSIARERKISVAHAAHVVQQEYSEEQTPDTRVFINKCAVTAITCIQTYEFLVRSRLNIWYSRIIVRKGYKVYCYE